METDNINTNPLDNNKKDAESSSLSEVLNDQSSSSSGSSTSSSDPKLKIDIDDEIEKKKEISTKVKFPGLMK